MPQSTHQTGFLHLPLELRAQIYTEYALNYAYTQATQGGRDPGHSLSSVCETVKRDFLGAFGRRGKYRYMISPDRGQFDSLSAAASGSRRLYTGMQCSSTRHMILDIYSPRPGSRSDILSILEKLQHFCAQLAKLPRPQSFTVRFCEDQDSRWIIARYPTNNLPTFIRGREVSDVENCLTMLKELRDMNEVTISIMSHCLSMRGSTLVLQTSWAAQIMMIGNSSEEGNVDNRMSKLEERMYQCSREPHTNIALEFAERWLRIGRNEWQNSKSSGKNEARLVRRIIQPDPHIISWPYYCWRFVDNVRGREFLQTLREREIWPGY